MDLLLDTHIAYWHLLGSSRLPLLAKELIGDGSNTVFVSLISAWEIGLKHAKRPDLMPIDAETFLEGCRQAGFVVLPIVEDQLRGALSVVCPEGLSHQDPFDRFLLGIASTCRMRFLTSDAKISYYQNPFVLAL